MPRRSKRTLVVLNKPFFFLSVGCCSLLWLVHLIAREGLQPDFEWTGKDIILGVIATGQLLLLANVVWRWTMRGPSDKQLVPTTFLLSLSFVIWLMDSGFQSL